MARKRYPIGIQTFDKIRTEDRLYIDKTEYVYRMTHSDSNYIFLGRPRRFGKSLLVSTLQSYFEGKKELFKGLAMKGGQGTEFLAQQLLEEVFNAVNSNQVDIIQRRLPQLEQVARTTPDANIQFYFHMLQASLKPESAAIAFLNARTDNYWQLFWVHVAYVKLKQNDKATVLLPRMGGFGAPQGDMALLTAFFMPSVVTLA